jgi:hypothetical protein
MISIIAIGRYYRFCVSEKRNIETRIAEYRTVPGTGTPRGCRYALVQYLSCLRVPAPVTQNRCKFSSYVLKAGSDLVQIHT